MSKFSFFAKKEEKKPLSVTPGRELGKVGGNGFTIPRLYDGTVYNTDEISVATYRKMKKDHQVSACLNLIRFTMQKVDWYVEGDEQAKKLLEDSIGKVWNQLIRSISKGVWAGYSPNVKVFEMRNGMIQLKKIRDLAPETCQVKTDSSGNFVGFFQKIGAGNEFIPAEYAFWYAHQMEDGNLYGNSMIKPAYKAWYYSELIHLFANRYYERFSEPVVKGSAPSTPVEDPNGQKVDAMAAMQTLGENLRNHSVVTVPSERDDNGNLLFDISYLESQMRGVDFDVYLKRLDAEKSRGIFVPALMFDSGGGSGSYALGEEHKATFITGLMGFLDDSFDYINQYIGQQLIDLNFPGQKATVKYTPLSKVTEDKIVTIVADLIKGGKAKADLKALSDRIGIPLEEDNSAPIATGTGKPAPAKTGKKETPKKQLERICRYLDTVWDKDKDAAITNLKIGFREDFDSEDDYGEREREIKGILSKCAVDGMDLEETKEHIEKTMI
jgi:hypothetical protein